MAKNDQELFELLRRRRNKLAKERGVKPFMIFHNKTLQEVSRVRPTTIEKLLEIKGIGQKKAEKYGQIILEVVNSSAHKSKVEKGFPEKVFSVAEFIRDLNVILTQKRALVLGEVSQISPGDGYLFFSLKDKEEEATLNCFVHRYQLVSFGADLKEGLEIKVSGFPRIYERTGRLTFEVARVGLVGEGALKQAFARLKLRLEHLGYFAAERKKTIPQFITSVGLITSQFADAKTDFLEHLGNFGFKIYLQDVRVEGLYAADEIVSAIKWFNENLPEVEVLVLTRGGGSLESLQAFNTETVAKAIFGSKIPIITGIGHESNETIADLVADFYASTPTHAARVLSDPWRNAESSISSYQETILSILARQCGNIRTQLNLREEGLVSEIQRFLVSESRKLSYLRLELGSSFREILEQVRNVEKIFLVNFGTLEKHALARKTNAGSQISLFWFETERWLKGIDSLLSEYGQKLQLSDPNLRLKQGYSIVFNAANRVIKSAKQLKMGENLNLKFHKGSASSRVERVNYD